MTEARRRLLIVLALSLGPAVSNSFARFAYALLLPAMRAELALTYAQAGWLNTANALGYLAGSVVTARYVNRIGNRVLFGGGWIVTALALIASGLTASYPFLLVLRGVTGVAGAMVFICGGVLASNLHPDRPDRAAAAIAIYFGGAGVGILMTGIGIPWLLALAGDRAWALAWLAIGAASLLFALPGIAAARRVEEPVAMSRAAAPWPAARFRAALASYFLFGVGYIAYMTFVIAWIVSRGAGPLQVALTWSMLGVATLIAPALWHRPLARWPGGRPLGTALLVVAVGAAIPLVTTSPATLLLSAFCFGAGMFTAPSAITALVKNALPKAAWGSAVAVFTAAFAIGQSLGPIVTGWLADLTGSLYAGLAGSVLVLLAASVAAFIQRASATAQAQPAAAPRSSPHRRGANDATPRSR